MIAHDLQNDSKETALHLATQTGSLELVKLLVDKGHAAIDIPDKDGRCAYQLVKAGPIAEFYKERIQVVRPAVQQSPSPPM